MKSKWVPLFVAIASLLLSIIRATATVYYVNAANPAPTPPFTSWADAATNIQDAIDLTTNGDSVMVTNGVYAYGGLIMAGDLIDRVALTNEITVQSVNGPWVTTILGAGATNGTSAVRCAWLTNGASLIGFTLTAGATRNAGDAATLESGGGVWCASSTAFVANCVIVSNSAYEFGGGVYQGTVTASLLSSNGNVNLSGGATYQSVLNNCTIVSNACYGAVSPLAMTNCIIYFDGPSGHNYSVSGTAFSHSCTTPALAGTGNFTNAPQLLPDGVHLATNSPCIGAGVGIAPGIDIFGNAWSNPPSIRCAEWSPDPVIITQPATQFPFAGGVAISIVVAGEPPFMCWWTKNGLPVQSDENHRAVNTTALLINNFALSDAGGYQVVVSNSFGTVTSATSQVSAHCVAPGGAASTPYSDWSSAATNIQDAINVAQAGDVVLVTNGLYAYGGLAVGGTPTNRVALTQAIMVQSVNGPWVTTIQGGSRTNGGPGTRCAWLTNSAALVGFTLEGGVAFGSQGNGGGVWCASSNAIVANCVICSNIAYGQGGGAYSGTLRNCAIYDNYAEEFGGGTYSSYLDDCTVTENSAGASGGGTSAGALTNCIVYYNSPVNLQGLVPISYCCTYPMPSGGVGNITNPPQLFVDNVHLLPSSPCIGAGAYLGSSTDIDGRPWLNPPSIGCSESPTVPLASAPVIQLTNNPVGFVLTAAITGGGPLSCWWLENGSPVQNNGQFSDAQTASLTASALSYADAGGYQLVVSNAFGMVTSEVAQVVMHCVDADGTNPVAPYLSWETAATNIQDAITAAVAGDIVLVTNGLYAYAGISMDGIITNCVSVNKAILVQSVNGAGATVIQGAWDPASTNGPGAVRCVWMTNNAILSGFTIQGGATRAAGNGQSSNGGGVWGAISNFVVNATVANCSIIGNCSSTYGGGAYEVILNHCTLASNDAVSYGGGGYHCDLRNCLITANFAFAAGGGTAYCQLTNCAVIGNSAVTEAGGVYYGTLINCTVTRNITLSDVYNYGGGAYDASFINSIVYGNSEGNSVGAASNYYICTFSYCCTAPAAAGTGNIAVDPQLLADGIHLAATSPCIGAGNAAADSGTDLDGQPWNNPPSIGCEEWQPAPVIVAEPVLQIGVPPRALTFGVLIAGQAPFAYFWSKDGVAVLDRACPKTPVFGSELATVNILEII